VSEFVTPYLPEEAIAHMRSWQAKGKIATVCAFEKHPQPICGNCQDMGIVYVSFLGDGPTVTPPTIRKAATYLEADGEKHRRGGWYIIEQTAGYWCPHCHGGKDIPAKPTAHRDTATPVAEVARQRRMYPQEKDDE
jgi:hypothetical protein